jgi:predicted nucleic acid-binding protein
LIPIFGYNEVCVNLLRKGKKRYAYLAQITEDLITASTIRADYHISYWDSLMIASALRADGQILYSEDMQNGLYIYKCLQI